MILFRTLAPYKVGKAGYDKEAENANTKATDGRKESRISNCSSMSQSQHWCQHSGSHPDSAWCTPGLPFSTDRGRGSYCQLQSMKIQSCSRALIATATATWRWVMVSAMLMLQVHRLFHTSAVKGCLFYSFFTPENWQYLVFLSRISVWN